MEDRSMQALLKKCNDNLQSLSCCHTDSRVCCCSKCWKNDFYTRPDTYECEKKLNFYVANYAPSFASEIYYYLKYSQLLENNFIKQNIKILSLGCGSAYDLLAINKYINNKQLPITLEYHGIDISNTWQSARYNPPLATFSVGDVTKSLVLESYSIIFVVKLFSTLYKHNKSGEFLDVFKNAVQEQMQTGSYIIFNDINSWKMGRDALHRSIKGLFSAVRQFYFGQKQSWTPNDWIQIPEKNIVFNIPSRLKIIPLQDIGHVFTFEYRR